MVEKKNSPLLIACLGFMLFVLVFTTITKPTVAQTEREGSDDLFNYAFNRAFDDAYRRTAEEVFEMAYDEAFKNAYKDAIGKATPASLGFDRVFRDSFAREFRTSFEPRFKEIFGVEFRRSFERELRIRYDDGTWSRMYDAAFDEAFDWGYRDVIAMREYEDVVKRSLGGGLQERILSDTLYSRFQPFFTREFGKVFKTEFGQSMSVAFRERGTGLSGYSFVIWTILMLLISFMIMEGREIKDKIFIKVVKNYSDEVDERDYEKTRKGTFFTFGEYKGVKKNNERRCYELRFRQGVNKYVIIYSLYTMEHYLSNHLKDVNYLIFYSIDAQIYKHALNKEEYYKRGLGYTNQALVYLAFSFCFNITPSGLVLSGMIGIIVGIFAFSMLPGLNILLGVAIFISLSVVNDLVLKKRPQVIKLMKPRWETVTEEFYLIPLECPVKYVNIYKVTGQQSKEIKLTDGTIRYEWEPLVGYQELDFISVDGKRCIVNRVEKKQKEEKKKENAEGEQGEEQGEETEKKPLSHRKRKKKKSAEEIQAFMPELLPKPEERPLIDLTMKKTDTPRNYIFVRGFDLVFEMLVDPMYDIIDYEVYAQEETIKTPHELINMTMEYLDRNRFYAEFIFRLIRENTKLQADKRNLMHQVSKIAEEAHRDLQDFAIEIQEVQRESKKTLKDYMMESVGDIVGRDWQTTLERILKKLNEEERRTRESRMVYLIKLMEKLISTVSANYQVSKEDLLTSLSAFDLGENEEENWLLPNKQKEGEVMKNGGGDGGVPAPTR